MPTSGHTSHLDYAHIINFIPESKLLSKAKHLLKSGKMLLLGNELNVKIAMVTVLKSQKALRGLGSPY